jgi:hypothetical protein
MFSLTNGDELQSRLDQRRGSTVVFSAHTHVPGVAQRGRIRYIGAPPVGFWPHALLSVDLEQSQMRVTMHRLVHSVHESPDPRVREPEYLARRDSFPTPFTMKLAGGGSALES